MPLLARPPLPTFLAGHAAGQQHGAAGQQQAQWSAVCAIRSYAYDAATAAAADSTEIGEVDFDLSAANSGECGQGGCCPGG